jgi:hypothetical protein
MLLLQAEFWGELNNWLGKINTRDRFCDNRRQLERKCWKGWKQVLTFEGEMGILGYIKRERRMDKTRA